MTENEQLKPCPFCGNKAVFVGKTRSIKCTKCGGAFIITNLFISYLDAIKAWNTRIEQEEQNNERE